MGVPVIQAPMANVSTPQVAGEVHKAGGLGSLPLSPVNLTKDVNPVFDLIDKFREVAGAKAPVNCNFFCFDPTEQHVPTEEETKNWQKLYSSATGVTVSEIERTVPDISARAVVSFAEFEQKFPKQCSEFVQRLIKAEPGIVLFHFGIPTRETIKAFQEGGLFVMGTATSVAEAYHLINSGLDGIVLQGYEAGGHRGNYLVDQTLDEQLSTISLFTRVMEQLSNEVFIVPAGGIVSGETAAFYLKRGAGAVQMGTVFIPVAESTAPTFIAESIGNANITPTIMTLLISGRSARTLATPFVRKLVTEQAARHYELPTFGYATAAYRTFANKRPEYGFYLAGKNYHLVETGRSTAEVVRKLATEIRSYL